MRKPRSIDFLYLSILSLTIHRRLNFLRSFRFSSRRRAFNLLRYERIFAERSSIKCRKKRKFDVIELIDFGKEIFHFVLFLFCLMKSLTMLEEKVHVLQAKQNRKTQHETNQSIGVRRASFFPKKNVRRPSFCQNSSIKTEKRRRNQKFCRDRSYR